MDNRTTARFKQTGSRIDEIVSWGITEVIIPDGITEISKHAFSNSHGGYTRNIESITFPDSVSAIGEFAMGCLPNLTTVRLPHGLRRIEMGTFFGCEKLTSIVLPKGVTHIGRNAFMSSGLVSIVIPNTVTSIENSAFISCTGLVSATIPKSVISFGDAVFTGCPQVTIYTTCGSTAEAYATKNRIVCKCISEEEMELALKKENEVFEPNRKNLVTAATTCSQPEVSKTNGSSVAGRKPNFAETLREGTKTKVQLENERAVRAEKEVALFVEKNVNQLPNMIRSKCKDEAEKGKRKMKTTFTLSGFSSAVKERQAKCAYESVRKLVYEELQQDHYRVLHVDLRKDSWSATKPYLKVYITW